MRNEKYNLLTVAASHFQFTGSNEPICSHFGCGKKLTLIETLAGNKCTGCMSNKKVLIDKVLKRA